MDEREQQIDRMLGKLRQLWMQDPRRTMGRVIALATPPIVGEETQRQPGYSATDAQWERELDDMLEGT